MDKKISEMTKATVLAGEELIPIVQNGTNMTASVNLIRKDLTTETWVQTAISNAGGKTVIVVTLPAKGDANKIYLLPNVSSKANDIYDEYIWLEGGWEFLGNKQVTVDLTPYYTKVEVDDKFVIAVTGKVLSTNDFTTELKSKLDTSYTKEQIDALILSLTDRITALEPVP